METKIPAWSFSSIKTFIQCPKKYFHLKVKKDYAEDFATEAILYGNQFHKAAEDYVKGTVEELDPRFSYAAPALVKLKSMPGEKLCEHKMGLTSNLEPCDFYAKDVWYRGIADLIVLDAEKKTAKIFDYKTGKSARYADKGQLELMALCVFAHFPYVQTVKAGLLFVVCNAVVREDFSVDNTSELWKKWGAEYGQLQRAYDNGVWNPRPTGLCKAHCVVLECPHNGKR